MKGIWRPGWQQGTPRDVRCVPHDTVLKPYMFSKQDPVDGVEEVLAGTN
jgi:hypothetical protein